MGKQKNTENQTIFAKLREDYNETHDKRMSQTDIGKKCNVSKSTISRVENGEIEPTLNIIKAYSKMFNMSEEELIKALQPKDTEQSENTETPKNTLSAYNIGISQEAISTYQLVKEFSNSDENLLAVLNSLVGNEQYTLNLLQSLFNYLVNQQPNGWLEDEFIRTMLAYINNVMKPQLQKVIKRNKEFYEYASSIAFNNEEESS